MTSRTQLNPNFTFAAIIELLNKAMTTLTSTEARNDTIVEELPDCSDLWNVSEYKDDDFWFMKVEEAEEVLAFETPQPISERQPEV